ncbi:hypothetical protein BH23GEM11_BH23GEM11_00600 [soil metagenome]
MASSEPVQERWTEVDALFASALEIPPGRRMRFVSSRTRGDNALREAVLTLLDSVDELGDFLESPLIATITDEDGSPERPLGALSGSRLGDYLVGEELGRGGLGVVYRAERIEGGFKQSVAIKVLRHPGRDGLPARFEQEREILARLRHPNISHLVGGGSTPGGEPYLVMGLVDGLPIGQFCDQRSLGLRERVRLFLRVCDAVASAHAHLVVHRDIKPSNVLVTPDGHPKLLDFGIARILDDASGDPTGAVTRTGATPMSPVYASPEQVRGDAVGTASDIYQLGLMLYELLSGSRPYRDVEQRPVELIRAICERDPVRPSRVRAAPGETGRSDVRMRHRLRGDLDTIILKAIRKEPGGRYGSVPELSEDLRRYLDGHPVRARPHGPLYRFRKFSRRNPVLVSLGAAFIVSGGAGGAGLLVHNERLMESRDFAETEAARAGATLGFMLELFESAGESSALDTMRVGQLLRLGGERLNEREEDPPEVRLALMQTLSSAFRRVGMEPEAHSLEERRIELARTHLGASHPELASLLLEIGSRRFIDRHWVQAQELLEESLEIQRSRFSTPPQVEADRIRLARTLLRLGTVYRETGRQDEAVSTVLEGLALVSDAPSQDDDALLAETGTLAYALRGEGRFSEADSIYSLVIDRLRARGEDARAHLPALLNNHASLLRAMGQFGEAEPRLREALEIRAARNLAQDDARETLHINLASLLTQLERHDEALEVAMELDHWIRSAYLESHWRVGRSSMEVGGALLAGGDCTQALVHIARAHAIYSAALGPDHGWTAGPQVLRAQCLLDLGLGSEARTLVESALPKLLEETNPRAGLIRRALEVLVDLNRLEGDEGEVDRVSGLVELLERDGPAALVGVWNLPTPQPRRAATLVPPL